MWYIRKIRTMEDLEYITETTTVLWIVGRDFNVILDKLKKLGGLPVTQQEVMDFSQCKNTCALAELPFIYMMEWQN